jgi:hypothetical protein
VDRRGNSPDVLAYYLADAVCFAEQNGFVTRIIKTTPPRGAGSGAWRVVRQRVADGGRLLELTVAAEDWGKEV